MNITAVKANNRRRAFELTTRRGVLAYPYARACPPPTLEDPLTEVWIDDELARQAVTYRLASGLEGFVHIDQVLEYDLDPRYMRDLLLHRLTCEALDRIEASQLSRREVIRRLGTSPAQFYRLLDPTNYHKSLDKVVQLLYALDSDVDLVVRERVPRDSAPRRGDTLSAGERSRDDKAVKAGA